MSKIKVTDYIAAALVRHGVRNVFELSGGMITHLLDSIHVHGKIQIVSVRHEQGAAFAADASGRMTGVPGVAMATSGPGATNLLTGIGSCHFDSSPAVFITGQVNRHEQKGDRKIRQLGFQETDIVSMARPVTKAAVKIETPEEVPVALEQAFATAVSGRPGPVVLDIPMDVQRALIEPLDAAAPDADAAPAPDPSALIAALRKAERPLILAGGGVRSGRAAAEFRHVVEACGVPVVNSLMAVDVLPFGHPLRVGMIGTYGNRWANIALSQCDFLLVLGSRLDVRQTGSETAAFKNGKTIFHVDCEPGEINNRVQGCVEIVAELRAYLPALAEACRGLAGRWTAWREAIEASRKEWPDTAELKDSPGINPNTLMHQLSRHAGASSAYVVDVGQHQMWAAQSLEVAGDQRFLTSGGMGSMGFALPAGVGVAVSVPGRPVAVIAGDGGFQCNIQELQTIAHLGLPVKMLVLNNRCHGMVRQFQESYFEARYPATYWGYSAPDFAAVAKAYGIDAERVEDAARVDECLARLWADPSKPALLEVAVDTFANAYPKIAFGRPISEMEPFARPLEMEST